MIITRLFGGLGNQMFQYAVGRALSITHEQVLKLDVEDLSAKTSHYGYELNRVFGIDAPLADAEDFRAVLGWQRTLRKVLARRAFRGITGGRIVQEPHFHYWPAVRSVSLPCYLAGYWQSELYFHDVSSALRSDFVFAQTISRESELVLSDIEGCNSVSVHVRRGDYAANARILAVHGMCSPDYYSRAATYIAERTESPTFFLFSDEPDWVAENIRLPGRTELVNVNRGLSSCNDMMLMSRCRHHIIANSTFSWWAAWLNPSPSKMVVAPARWFASNAFNTSALLPSSWAVV